MDFLPSEIARLVLGYLEDEGYESAYESFLANSPNLIECLKMREMGRKFRTTVLGLSLIDILREYSAIYSAVHEQLRKIDKETADSFRKSGSLLDKLTYLINANGSGQTMLFSITLPGKSPNKSAVAHVRKRLKPGTKERLRKTRVRSENDSVCEELNDSRINPSDVDATPLCSLPGNNDGVAHNIVQDVKDDEISRTPMRKSGSSVWKNRSVAGVSEVEENIDFSLLTKTLIDSTELHEKLAENINRVIGTPDLSQPIASTSASTSTPNVPLPKDCLDPKPCDNQGSIAQHYSTSFCTDLDNAIKKIVEDTSADPVFENLLNFMTGPVNDETSDDYEDRRVSNTSTPQKTLSDPNNDGSNSSDQGDQNNTVILAKSRFRNTKLKLTEGKTEGNTPFKLIDVQNADAVKSIIAVNSELQQKDTLNTINTVETVVCDTVSTTVIKATTVTASAESTTAKLDTDTVVTNSSESITSEQQQGVVLSQPKQWYTSSVVTQPTILLTTATPPFSHFHQEKRLMPVWGQATLQQPYVIQQPQYQRVYTEREINAMPVFMNHGTCAALSIPPPPSYSSMAHTREVKQHKSSITILPKIQENEESTTQFSITVIPNNNKGQEAKVDIKPVGNNVQVTISPVKQGRSVPMIQNESVVETSEVPLETPKPVTPPKANSQPRQSLSTPRSGKSHIRALDFSTPPKGGVSPRRANTSPKTIKRSSSLNKSSKKKTVRTSLFASKNDAALKMAKNIASEIKTKTPKTTISTVWDKVQGTEMIINPILLTEEEQQMQLKPKQRKKGTSWDEDLRAGLCNSESLVTIVSPKSVPKSAKKIKTNAKKKENLNNTEDEVSKIESALNVSNETIKDKDTKVGENKVTETVTDSEQAKSEKVVPEKVKEKPVKEKPSKRTKRSSLSKDSTEEEVKQPSKKTKRSSISNDKKEDSTEEVKEPTKKTKKSSLSKDKKEDSAEEVKESTKKTKKSSLSKDKKEDSTDEIKESTKKTKKSSLSKDKKEDSTEEVKESTKKTKKSSLSKDKKEDSTEEIKESTKKTKKSSQNVDKKEDSTEEVKEEAKEPNVDINVESEITAEAEINLSDENTKLRNMKPRVNKKCNLGNSARKVVTTQNDQPINKLEQDETDKNMKVVSPSKYNANKRTLVENESKTEVEKQPAEIPPIESLDTQSSSKITPVMYKISEDNPITFKTNLTPILETPQKIDILSIPLTPNIFSPFSVETPFSKIFKENMGSVDISTINTPNFPITPNFRNLTPNSQVGDDPYNRPTDYSTSSSYYQPSDSEHNQVMDSILIEESKTMNKKKHSVNPTDPLVVEVSEKSDTVTLNYVLNEISLTSPAKTGFIDITKYKVTNDQPANTEDPLKLSTEDVSSISVESTESPVTTSKRRKRNNSSSTSSSSSSCCSSSSSDESSDDSEKADECNTTMIHVPLKAAAETSGRYMLRSRRTPSKEKAELIENPQPVKTPKKKNLIIPDKENIISENVPVEDENKANIPEDDVHEISATIKPTTSTKNRIARTKINPVLLKTMEEKRNRILKSLKDDKKSGPTKKNPVSKKPVKPKAEVQRKTTRPTKKQLKIQDENDKISKESKLQKQSEEEAKQNSKPACLKNEEGNKVNKNTKSPRKSESIESVATKLKQMKSVSVTLVDCETNKLNEESKDNESKINVQASNTVSIKHDDSIIEDKNKLNAGKSDARTKLIEKVVCRRMSGTKDNIKSNMIESKRKSIDTMKSHDDSLISDSSVETFKDEEIPRLHISDDDEPYPGHPEKITEDPTNEKKLRELKEWGIHLIPKNPASTDTTKKDQDELIIMHDSQNALKQKFQVHNVLILPPEEKIDLSKIKNKESINDDDVINKQKSPVVEMETKDSEPPKTNILDKHDLNQTEKEETKTLNESEDDDDYILTMNTITEDSPSCFKYTHDESLPTKPRSISTDILARTIEARLYSGLLKKYIDVVMRITPYTELFTFSENITSIQSENIIKRVVKLSSEKNDSEVIEKGDLKAAEGEKKEIVKTDLKSYRIPKLKNKKSSPVKTEGKLIISTHQQNKSEKTKSNISADSKNENITLKEQFIQEVTDNTLKEKVDSADLEKNSQTNIQNRGKNVKLNIKSSGQCETKISPNIGDKKETTVKKSIVESLGGCKTEEREEDKEILIKKIDVEKKKGSCDKSNEEEDELMTLNAKITDGDKTAQELNWKKRKMIMDNDISPENPEKRNKPDQRNVLHNIDIEHFLNNLHGHSKK